MTETIDHSKLVPYSQAIVLEDKATDSDDITVLLIEQLPLSSGLLSENTEDLETTIRNAKGHITKNKVTRNETVTAKWIPKGSDNRMTSPDVVKGETVEVYRYGSSDRYYWCTLLREPSLRRLEHVVYAFCDLKGGTKSFNIDEAYTITVSTRDKMLRVKTVQADGEPVAFDVVIDTMNGVMSFEDTESNSGVLDSQRGELITKINNLVKTITSKYEIDCDEMYVKANDKVTFDTPLVHNTGDEKTDGQSYANPHNTCDKPCNC